MQGIITKSMNKFPKKGEEYMIKVQNRKFYVIIRTISYRLIPTLNTFIFQVKMSSSGPAFTLKIHEANTIKIDIDLVPCFKFSNDKWPESYRKCPNTKKVRTYPMSRLMFVLFHTCLYSFHANNFRPHSLSCQKVQVMK